MLNRRWIQYIVVLLLALLVMVLIRPWSREGDSRHIALKNPELVDRIVLADAFNTSELNKRDGIWYLYGTEEVSVVSVDNLLFAASRLEVGSITEFDTFLESGEQGGWITELNFFRGERVLLSYEIRRQGDRYLVIPDNSERAFYVSLPGYPDLDLERVFSAAPDHFREHLLIDLRPSEIASIEIALASGESFGFTQDQEGNIVCAPASDSTRIPEGEPSELAMKLLFSYFTSIRYEQRTEIAADSLLGNPALYPWMATVQVNSFSGEHHSLQVFPYPSFPGSEPDLFKALVLYNKDRDALIINYIYLDVLMRGISHYIGEK